MILHKQFVPAIGLGLNPRRASFLFLLAALLLLLLAAAPSAQAQGSRCTLIDGWWSFMMPSSGYMKGTYPMYRNSNCSPPSTGSIRFGKYGSVEDRRREDAIAKCKRHTGFSKMDVGPSGLFWSCKPIFDSDGGSGSGSSTGRGNFYVKPEIRASKLPLGSVTVKAELGLNSGIQFQRFDHYAVGVKSVVDRGILDVVDVWGQAAQNFEVCFPQAGAIVFLDASTSPRSLVEVESFARDGYTCGAMNRAGTMVLVKGSSSAESSHALAQEFIDSTTDPISSAIALDGCTVTSAHNLNLREAPWAAKITVLPKHTSVPASARTESWYRVRYTPTESEGDEADTKVESVEGWISAWLSEAEGDCDWRSDDEDSPALASSEITPLDDAISVASLVRGLEL